MADERDRRDEQTERQNRGYDEAANGGPNMPDADLGIPLNPGEHDVRTGDEFDCAAREAEMDVRRREHSAD